MSSWHRLGPRAKTQVRSILPPNSGSFALGGLVDTDKIGREMAFGKIIYKQNKKLKSLRDPFSRLFKRTAANRPSINEPK